MRGRPTTDAAALSTIRGLVDLLRDRPSDPASPQAGARPLLLAWSQHHDHLREITREEVLAALNPLHDADRQDALLALQSLFGWAKRTGVFFRDSISRIKVGERVARIITPLSTEQVDAWR